MDEAEERPSRRGLLVMLGLGAVAPAAVAWQLRRPVGGELDGLRFDVLAVRRRPRAGHTQHGRATAAAEHASWPDVVRVQLQVRNLASVPLLVSPGQFRLRVHGDLSVMPTAWRHEVAALGAGETRSGWIDYRAPDVGGLYQLEFTGAGQPQPVAVTLAVPAGAA